MAKEPQAVQPLQLLGVDISNFRGIRSGSVTGFGNVNLVVGSNGSGKSSLLAALFLPTLAFSEHRDRHGLGPLPESTNRIFQNTNRDWNPTDGVWFGHDRGKLLSVRLRFNTGAKASLQMGGPRGEKPVLAPELSALDRKPELTDIAAFIRGSRALDARTLLNPEAERHVWDRVLRIRSDREVVKTVNRIYGLSLETLSYSAVPLALKVLFEDRDYALDLRDLGSGIQIAVRLLLWLSTVEGGAFIIEEFDAYQHVKALERLAPALVDLSTRRRVQLFLSTHSAETIDAFVRASIEHTQLRVIQTSLDSTGQFKTALLDPSQAKTLLEAGVDVRQ